ncbi:hypothetical protein F2Q70_00001888 [Brassica cretica]|uniref:Neprosin PEP catalytic domain-containing protein n=1 Tax=Brassica cretica TaxID=69181 RepID=A0A8S9IRP7_BRACR|nr:hypothetical protein F2Q70_00001888 [Brassica cretica]
MSTILMSLVMNLLSLLLSTAIVYSNQSTMPLRSFKMSENVIYDCIDIYKQPGLNHPYLKTHKIQVQFLSISSLTFLLVLISPGLYGDQRVWTFGFWKGKDGKGCYNTACSGFVQVSKVVPIVQPNDLKPGVPGFLDYFIHQDKNTGNWWITRFLKGAPSVDISYWPKELFNLLENGANMAGVGGVVQASRSGSSPPMGNGNFPNGGHLDSAIFTNIEVLNSTMNNVK